MFKRGALLLAGVTCISSPARALNQSKHYDLALGACRAVGLPEGFCQRAAVETYNVDHNEFNVLAAHSQIPSGKSACDAANDSLWRVFWLGGQMRQALEGAAWSPSRAGNDQLAQHLGRALHTVQDNCAHRGMPNPQHAWHSLSDTCDGTSESPDVQPDAFACASDETDTVLGGFVDALHDAGAQLSDLSSVTGDDDKHWPRYSDVCDYLASAKTWDGEDRRWDNQVMRPALTAQLLAGLSGADDSQFQRVCGDGADITAAWSDPDFDTSNGPPSCLKIHAACLGKADSDAEGPPPWENEAATTATTQTQGGCSATPGAPATSLLFSLWVLFGYSWLGRRRRGTDAQSR
jgi:hypothetical protein